jgi:O-antigen/teichoic acid export membrane protein
VEPGLSDELRHGARDSLLLALGALASAGLGLVSLRLLLTHLSEVEYGRYALFLAAGGLVGVFLLWPTHAVLRLGADEAQAGGRGGRTLGSVGLVVTLSLAGVLLAGALAPTALPPEALALVEKVAPRPLWPLVGLFAALSAAANLGYALSQPFGRNHLRTLLPALPKLLFVLALGGAVLASVSLDVAFAAWLATLTIAPVILVAGVLVRPGWPRPHRTDVRRTLSFGAPLFLRNLGVAGILFVDVLLVRALLGEAPAGRYDVAYRIGEQVVTFGFVLTFLAGPILARAASRGDTHTLGRFYRLAAPPMVWLWCLGAGLTVVLAEPLLHLLGAKSAATSARVLEVLMLAVAIRGAAVLEIAVFEAHLLSRWPTLFFFCGFALNLALGVGLIRAGWGLMGPAVATVAGFALQAILRAAYVHRRFKVPAFGPYWGVLPVVFVLMAQRAGGWPAGALTWVLAALLVVGLGRRTRLFSRDARALLQDMSMPSRLRSLLVWLHAGPSTHPSEAK